MRVDSTFTKLMIVYLYRNRLILVRNVFSQPRQSLIA